MQIYIRAWYLRHILSYVRSLAGLWVTWGVVGGCSQSSGLQYLGSGTGIIHQLFAKDAILFLNVSCSFLNQSPRAVTLCHLWSARTVTVDSLSRCFFNCLFCSESDSMPCCSMAVCSARILLRLPTAVLL